MKVVSPGYETYRTTATSTRDWHFLKLVRTDDEVFGFTNGDREREIDGVTYVPGFRPFAVQSPSDLQPTNTETEGGFSDDAVTDVDVRAGKWDHAYYEYFRAKWDDLSLGIEKIASGYLGQLTNGRTQFVAEINGIFDLLTQQIGRIIQPACDTDLGSARCKVRLDPPTWVALTAYTVRPAQDAGLGSVVKPSTPNNRHFKCTTAGTSGASEPVWNTTLGGTTNDGSVVWTTFQALTVYSAITSVADERLEFRDNTRAEAADFFAYIEFTSGDNDGIGQDVRVYEADGTFTLQLPMPFDVQVGDTYFAQARCRKDFQAHCKTLFDNGNNHQGYPFVPGLDYLASGKVQETEDA